MFFLYLNVTLYAYRAGKVSCYGHVPAKFYCSSLIGWALVERFYLPTCTKNSLLLVALQSQRQVNIYIYILGHCSGSFEVVLTLSEGSLLIMHAWCFTHS